MPLFRSNKCYSKINHKLQQDKAQTYKKTVNIKIQIKRRVYHKCFYAGISLAHD